MALVGVSRNETACLNLEAILASSAGTDRLLVRSHWAQWQYP